VDHASFNIGVWINPDPNSEPSHDPQAYGLIRKRRFVEHASLNLRVWINPDPLIANYAPGFNTQELHQPLSLTRPLAITEHLP
jgi:hypothetical protein